MEKIKNIRKKLRHQRSVRRRKLGLSTPTQIICVSFIAVIALGMRDTWTQFTWFGQAVVLLLIQVGGLGTDELNIVRRDLVKGDRVVWIDLQGVCHEHIVDTIDRVHDDDGARPRRRRRSASTRLTRRGMRLDDKRPSGSVSVALTSILVDTRAGRLARAIRAAPLRAPSTTSACARA